MTTGHGNSLVPLNQWYCDDCGQIIETAEQGWVEWWTKEVTADTDEKIGEVLVKYGLQIKGDLFEKLSRYLEELGEYNVLLEDDPDCDESPPEPVTFVVQEGFRIVHHSVFSPKKPLSDCYKYLYAQLQTGLTLCDSHLDGLKVQLEVWESESLIVEDCESYKHFKRRLTLPYYEEAYYTCIAQAHKEGLIDLTKDSGAVNLSEYDFDTDEGVLGALRENDLSSPEKLKRIIHIGHQRYGAKQEYIQPLTSPQHIVNPQAHTGGNATAEIADPSPAYHGLPDGKIDPFYANLFQGRIGEAVVEVFFQACGYLVHQIGGEVQYGPSWQQVLRRPDMNKESLAMRNSPDLAVVHPEKSEAFRLEVKSTRRPMTQWEYEAEKIAGSKRYHPDAVLVVCHFPGLEIFAKKLADIDIDTQTKSPQGKLKFDLVQEFSRLDEGYVNTVFAGVEPKLATAILTDLRSRLSVLVESFSR